MTLVDLQGILANIVCRFYFIDFDINNEWEQGLINGAPYLCCLVVGCWISPVMNKYFGRRGTIFICCFISVASGIWQAVTFDKWQLFAARFFSGFAIGSKSSTTPAYAAECSPPKIRGALGTQWQMWTAFGIMLGFVASVAFYPIRAGETLPGLSWRLMLASTSIPPIIVCIMTYFAPESPRWLMSKGRYQEAFESLITLRKTRLMAARDLYDIHVRLELEKEIKPGSAWARATKLFAVPRNRRAAQSAFFVMYMQQFCGVNIIAYYSSQIFRDAGFGAQQALLASLGTGLINWYVQQYYRCQDSAAHPKTNDFPGCLRFLAWSPSTPRVDAGFCSPPFHTWPPACSSPVSASGSPRVPAMHESDVSQPAYICSWSATLLAWVLFLSPIPQNHSHSPCATQAWLLQPRLAGASTSSWP